MTRKVARHRPTSGTREPKGVSFIYNVRDVTGKLVPVCRGTFLSILRISRNRLSGVLGRYHKTGEVPKESRGGDRHSLKNTAKRNAVKAFIEKFNIIESHYCRGNSKRQYLSPQLNIKMMWRLYNEQCLEVSLKVRECFFRNIFNREYNIGFGSPRTDVCSTCLSLTERIKHENNADKKQDLMVEKRVHKLRAAAFFQHLREERRGLMTFSYDCQKNLVLPKVPDQSAYYSRQLYIYNFAIVKGSSKGPLNPQTVKICCWTETERPKGSNEIASCVFNCLLENQEDMVDVDTVRLVADGCAGQNKNSIMVGMCSKWLKDHAPRSVKKIELIFPVSGHSYIPPDRVFGLIEKDIRKNEVIADPQEYIDIFSRYGTIVKVGHDFPVCDWKTAALEILKPPGQWHFKFKPAKRIILHRTSTSILVQGEESYRTEIVNPKGVCKKGKLISSLIAGELPNENTVKPFKLRDVRSLLVSHYGRNWSSIISLEWYKSILEGVADGGGEEDDGDEEEVICEQQLPYAGLVV